MRPGVWKHLMQRVSFDISRFPFSGGLERDHWHEMGVNEAENYRSKCILKSIYQNKLFVDNQLYNWIWFPDECTQQVVNFSLKKILEKASLCWTSKPNRCIMNTWSLHYIFIYKQMSTCFSLLSNIKLNLPQETFTRFHVGKGTMNSTCLKSTTLVKTLAIKTICDDALRDLVPFVQFKKGEKHPCNVNKGNTPPWVFFTFLNWTNGTKSRNASMRSMPLEEIHIYPKAWYVAINNWMPNINSVNNFQNCWKYSKRSNHWNWKYLLWKSIAINYHKKCHNPTGSSNCFRCDRSFYVPYIFRKTPEKLFFLYLTWWKIPKTIQPNKNNWKYQIFAVSPKGHWVSWVRFPFFPTVTCVTAKH